MKRKPSNLNLIQDCLYLIKRYNQSYKKIKQLEGINRDLRRKLKLPEPPKNKIINPKRIKIPEKPIDLFPFFELLKNTFYYVNIQVNKINKENRILKERLEINKTKCSIM